MKSERFSLFFPSARRKIHKRERENVINSSKSKKMKAKEIEYQGKRGGRNRILKEGIK